MLELVDEIGKHHCSVLRILKAAYDKNQGKVPCIVYEKIVSSNKDRLSKDETIAYTLDRIGGDQYLLAVGQDVFSQLLSHGLIEQFGHSQTSIGGISPNDMSPQHRPRDITITACGRDFCSRWYLLYGLSFLPAKWNKWIAPIIVLLVAHVVNVAIRSLWAYLS